MWLQMPFLSWWLFFGPFETQRGAGAHDIVVRGINNRFCQNFKMAVVGVVGKLVVLGIFASFLLFLKNEAMSNDSFYDMFEVTKVLHIYLFVRGQGL